MPTAPAQPDETTRSSHRWRRLLPYALEQWRSLAILWVLALLAPVLTALSPWPMKLLIDYALGDMAVPAWLSGMMEWSGHGGKSALVLAAALAAIGVFILAGALECISTLLWGYAGQRMVYRLGADLLARLQRLSLHFHARQNVGDLLSRISGDAWCVYTAAESLLISPLQQVVTILFLGIIAWQLDPVLTLLSLAAAPLLGGATYLLGPAIKRRAQMQRRTESHLFNFVHQTLGAISVVQTTGAGNLNRIQFDQLADDAVALSQRGVVLRQILSFVGGMSTTIGTGIVMLAGAWRVLGGAMTVGSLLVFIAYLHTLQASVLSLLRLYGTLKQVEANVDRVIEVLASDDRIEESPDAVPLQVSTTGRGLSVDFEQVSFGYDHSAGAVLHEINLNVPAGRTVALVGPTGAGKSTLVSLIPRLFDPWSGNVRLAGQDLRSLTLASLRQNVAVVPQEPHLLPISIARNIAYGRPEASMEQIQSAAESSGAADFIEALPQGYATLVGERGVSLSGGQRQLIAIARALLRDAPVLILDEPSAALDARTERLLMEALERLCIGRTCLIIAHRLSTVRLADAIVVLENGRIVEEGTHAELLRHNGLYHKFHDLQFASMDSTQPAPAMGAPS